MENVFYWIYPLPCLVIVQVPSCMDVQFRLIVKNWDWIDIFISNFFAEQFVLKESQCCSFWRFRKSYPILHKHRLKLFRMIISSLVSLLLHPPPLDIDSDTTTRSQSTVTLTLRRIDGGWLAFIFMEARHQLSENATRPTHSNQCGFIRMEMCLSSNTYKN